MIRKAGTASSTRGVLMEAESCSVTELLVKASSLVPIWHYIIGIWIIVVIYLYRLLEFHLFEELFGGNYVCLTFNSDSIYAPLVSKCRLLHGRYLATPWLSSPHLQTAFLNFFGRPPHFIYTRQLFNTPDGGTIAFDWLSPADVTRPSSNMNNKDDATTPIVVVIPGLMSDSSAAYIKHLVFNIAKNGRKAVVCNHRGLGGVSLTSDWFYNAGWTEDLRTVVDYFHDEYPRAALFAVGTSIGANVLVKYLGEDGDNTHIAGAAAICSPWDLLICDRFISRKLVQRLYSRAIAVGLQLYAQTHQSIYSRLADWEGIRKARSVRDFDNHATCILGKYETADAYYRHSSSAGYVKNVTVPLLCISALDDPVCTREAIPRDECRANKNVILATTPHGGHLAFFEGLTANGLWWVNAVDEFFSVLHSSPLMHKQKETRGLSAEPQIEQGAYVSFTDDGVVSAMVDEGSSNCMAGHSGMRQYIPPTKRREDMVSNLEQETEVDTEASSAKSLLGETMEISKDEIDSSDQNVGPPRMKRRLKELSRHNKRSMWLLAYIAVVTTWPLFGPGLLMLFKRRVRNAMPTTTWLRK